MAAANRKTAAETSVNAQTKPTESRPAGMARVAVRGLRASRFRSAMRLKAIAAERAPTIATMIQRICRRVGRPLAASTAPRKANGSAKSVCSILIISSVKRVFLMTVDTVGQSSHEPGMSYKPGVASHEPGMSHKPDVASYEPGMSHKPGVALHESGIGL